MIGILLSNVPLATANTLAYIILILVASWLVIGSTLAYYFLKKKGTKADSPTGSA